MHPRPSKRKELSTARAATASASSPWISTWPASTCWRANSPGRRHFLDPPSLLFPQCCNLTLSERRVLQETLNSHTSLHFHAPTKVGWSCGSKMVVVICIYLSREGIERFHRGQAPHPTHLFPNPVHKMETISDLAICSERL